MGITSVASAMRFTEGDEAMAVKPAAVLNVSSLIMSNPRRPAFETWPSPVAHTLGTGLRLVIPQFNSQTIRIDFGLVLGQPVEWSMNRFSASWGQVNDFRTRFLDDPLN